MCQKFEIALKSPPISDSEFFFYCASLKKCSEGKDKQEKEEGTFRIPTLRCTPLPQRIEQPKSPEAKSFDVPLSYSSFPPSHSPPEN